MKPENRLWLEQNYPAYVGFIRNMTLPATIDYEKALRVMREEWRPGYNTNLADPGCRGNMLKDLFYLYQVELNEEEQPAPIKISM